MRIISRRRLREFWTRHRRSKSSLEHWYSVVRAAEWKRFEDVRATFRSADQVKVASGRRVVVFNVGGNAYRIIAAVHYNFGKVFVLRVMTHRDYDKSDWRATL